MEYMKIRVSTNNLFSDISTWAGNGTAIDVLVKPHAVENVTAILKKEKIRYEVVVENLQKMIDEENPPLDENELELQDRRGILYFVDCVSIIRKMYTVLSMTKKIN